MSTRKKRTTRSIRPTRRTQIVWVCFVAATTLVIAVLALGDGGFRGGFMAIRPTTIGGDGQHDPIFRTTAPLDHERWTGIVIHHSGQPAGDAASLRELHMSWGLQGLGHHFVVGNGRGMGAGDVYVGERWINQQPGAHTVGANGDAHNQRSVGICLVGNGDRRPFADEQIESVISLVRRLQRELGIPADRVFLHNDVAAETTSPGRFFPVARLREQLLAGSR